MSCPHTETTAVLAAFGEAPSDFEAHLTDCEACRTVVRQHTATLATLEPLREQACRPTPVRRWSPHSVGFLLAAAVLLAAQFTHRATDTAREQVDSPIHAQTIAPDIDPFDDGLDEQLASLELELDLFYLEES